MNSTLGTGPADLDDDDDADLVRQLRSVNQALIVSSVRQHELAELAAVSQTALANSEERFRVLFESSPMAVFVCNTEAVIQQYNRRAAELWGCEPECGPEQCFGSHGVYLADGTPLPCSFSPMVDVLRTGEPVHNFEVVLEKADGSRIPVMVNISALRDDRGEITGSVTSMEDITERKQLEDDRERLLRSEQEAHRASEAANQAKDVFLATLSHELRTPLNAVLGWTVMLREGGTCSGPEAAEGLAVIERNARIQIRLIADVLDIARIVSGKFTIDPRPCDFTALALTCVDTVRPSAVSKGVAINVEVDTLSEAAHLWVFGDPARLQQLLWNLLTNSIKFTPAGGTIVLRIAAHDAHARITIADTGKGISAAFLPFVFDRFKQADEGTTRSHGGLGLGLSIVRQIAELHGGTVRAESPGDGLGSTFTLDLPLHDRPASIHPPVPPPSNTRERTPAFPVKPVLQGTRVLVVEDELDARALIVHALESFGAAVTSAASAADGFRTATESPVPFHVLVCDIGMPLEDGYSLRRRLQGAGYHAESLPALALTAFVSPKDAQAARDAGFQLHLAKPLDPRLLVEAVLGLAQRTLPS